jgi:hypothetical protein
MNRIGLALGAIGGAAGAVGTFVLGRSLRGEGDDGGGITAPLDDFVRGLGGEVQFVRGAGAEVANIVGHHVHIPFAPGGTVFEPHGEMQHAGAGAVDALGRLLGAVPKPHDPADTRDQQPLLAEANVTVDTPGPTTLAFRAETDANWGVKGRESVLAAVYVDGRYVSDMPLLGERKEGYRVLLGDLPAGEHRVELRIAEGSPITDPAAAQITKLRAGASSQPLVDRYAPIIEARDLGTAGDPPELGYDDTPMVLTPVLTKQQDGTTRIDYHMLFSNEDGGTATGDLMHKYGRITDYEPIYSVLVDADGARISDSFQTTGHKWMSFDGRREGDRPVMRVGTDNNLMTSVIRDDGHRWTGAPTAVRDAAVGSRTVMNEHEWTWSVMGRELEREDKQAAVARLDDSPVDGDPRDYLYVANAERGNLPEGEHVTVTLDTGAQFQVRQKLDKNGVTAVPMPTGVSPTSITRIEGIASGAYILDDAFQPHEVDVVAPLPALVPDPKPDTPVYVPPADEQTDEPPQGIDEQLPDLPHPK